MSEDLPPEELGEKMREARALGRFLLKGTLGLAGGILQSGGGLLSNLIKGLSPGDQDSIKRSYRNGFHDDPDE